MPRKGQVKVKSTERKEELEAIKEKRGEKRDRDENDSKSDSVKKIAPKKKKVRKDDDEAEELDWNQTHIVLKDERTPAAEATITPAKFPDLSKLKDHLYLGKMRGNDLDTKTHITFPLRFIPDLDKPNVAQKIRFSLNSKHQVSEPTQFEKKDETKGKKKGTQKKTADDKKLDPWTLNVPIDPDNKRDDYISKAISIVYNFVAEQLDSDLLWKSLSREHLKPKSATDILRVGVSDQAEGSFWRIKFVWNTFTKHKRFDLFDFRGKDVNKKNPPSTLPGTIKDGNEVDGTWEIDDLYLRPEDQMAGFSFIWSACRLHNGQALKDDDSKNLYQSMRIGVFEEDEAEEASEDEEEGEDEEDEEDEEEEAEGDGTADK